MRRGIKGCFTSIGAAIVLIVVIAAIAGGSSGKKHASGATHSPALVTTQSAGQAAQHHKAVHHKPQTFRGTGTENIGTVAVPVQSTLYWQCSSCGSDNFVVNNNFNDDSTIDVNALNQKSGKTVVDAGTYHDVEIDTEGQGWTIRIVPGT